MTPVGRQAREGSAVTATDTLEQARQAVLAVDTAEGPTLAAAPAWFDGSAVWCVTSAESEIVAALTAHRVCRVTVGGAGGGVVADGHARCYGPDLPLATALHGLPILAVLGMIGARRTAPLSAALRNPARVAGAWPPAAPAVLRVRITDPYAVAAPTVEPALAPGLPAAVPADVRRAVAGLRRVVVAVRAQPGRLEVAPTTWQGSYDVDLAAATWDVTVSDAPRPAAVLLTAAQGEQEPSRGLVLTGDLRGTRLSPQGVRWWRGSQTGSATLSPSGSDALQLPD